MSVHTYVDMSTGHVSRATMKLLEDGSGVAQAYGWPAMTIAPYEYGVFVTVPDLEACEPEQRTALPLELELVFRFANEWGADVIRFDADADQIVNLQIFDW